MKNSNQSIKENPVKKNEFSPKDFGKNQFGKIWDKIQSSKKLDKLSLKYFDRESNKEGSIQSKFKIQSNGKYDFIPLESIQISFLINNGEFKGEIGKGMIQKIRIQKNPLSGIFIGYKDSDNKRSGWKKIENILSLDIIKEKIEGKK